MFPADLATSSKEAQMSQLKEIVARTLEKKGVLSKLKAQLRKHIFDALEEQENAHAERDNGSGKFILDSDQDRIAFEIVREYLSFHQLDYTLSMLETEAELKEEQVSRSKLATNLRLGAQRPDPQQSVLDQIVKHNYVKDVFSAHHESPPRKLVLQERSSLNNTSKSPPRHSSTDDMMNMLTDRESFLSGIETNRRSQAKSPPPEFGGLASMLSGNTTGSKFGVSNLSSKSSSVSPAAKLNETSPPKLSSAMSNLSDLPPLSAPSRSHDLTPIGSRQQGDKLLQALDDILDSDEEDGNNAMKQLQGNPMNSFNEMKTADPNHGFEDEEDEYDDDDEFGSVEESDGIAADASDSDGSNPYAIDSPTTSKDELAVSGDLEKRSDIIVDLV